MKHKAARNQDDFTTTPERLRETLEKFGVAILPSVLDADETKQMQKGYWKLLQQLSAHSSTPIRKANRQSWETFCAFKPLRGMLNV